MDMRAEDDGGHLPFLDHPVKFDGFEDVVSVAVGGEYNCSRMCGQTHLFICAVTGAGTVECMGDIYPWDSGPPIFTSDEPVEIPGADSVVQIAAGLCGVCVLSDDGGVSCFGCGLMGGLGNGELEDSPVLVEVQGLAGVRSIAALSNEMLAATEDGKVWAWGNLSWTGGGEYDATPLPIEVPESEGVVQVSEYAAIKQNREAWTFPYGCPMPSGLCDPEDYGIGWQKVAGISDAVAVLSENENYTCIARQAGSIECVGPDMEDYHGTHPGHTIAQPTLVPGASAPEDIAFSGTTTCAVQAEDVLCWGSNSYGQAGQPKGNFHLAPTEVPGLKSVAAIEGLWSLMCVAAKVGGVSCWGSLWDLEMEGAPDATFEPTAVSGFPELIDLAIMQYGSGVCGLSAKDGSVRCRLSSLSPKVEKLGTFKGGVRMAAFDYELCVVNDEGIAACWEDVTYDWNPLPIDGLADVKSIDIGPSHKCALTNPGEVFCWGENDVGQLGLGAEEVDVAHEAPSKVAGVPAAVDMAVGWAHTCALAVDGSVWCWGSNTSGESGLGDIETSPSPSQVPGLSNVDRVYAGDHNTCAVAHDGQVFCWGANGSGQAGAGVFPDFETPVPVRGIP